jgi:DNA-binding transcriptional MerR regulator
MHHTTETRKKGQGFREYSIGVISRLVDLSQKTIRDYEKIGLIKPRRDPRTNNRIYSDFEIEQIQQISHLIHNEGFTLPCIKRLLQLAPCWNIFDCEVKEKCPAYEYTPTPCYETREKKETLCSGACEQCAVYINRSSKKDKVLQGPRQIAK